MNRKVFVLLLTPLVAWSIFTFGATGDGTAFAQDAPAQVATSVETPSALLDEAAQPLPEFVPGQLLVGVSSDQVASANTLAGPQAQTLASFDAGDPEDGVTTLLVSVPVGSEAAALTQLQSNPAVVYAEPNWIVHAADETASLGAGVEPPFPVNDPFYATQQWYLQRMGMARAWQLTQADDGFASELSSVVVSVIDSGVDATHPDFAGRMLPGVNYISPNTPVVDDCGHGTHVAGLVAAGLNNAKGIAGPAPAYIEARKVLQVSGTGCSGSIANVARAIRDAADASADVINLSLTLVNNSETIRLAVEYASARGALMIAASGNAGASVVYYPARYPQVMAVAALDRNDGHAIYSNRGSEIEIAAPGGATPNSIFSTWSNAAIARCTDGYQSSGGASYCNSTGTSMAAGLVSGVAALALAVAPDLSASQVRSLLRDTATALPLAANQVGSGKVNPTAALRRLLTSEMALSPTTFQRAAPIGSAPYTLTVRLENPSLDNLDWRATLPANTWSKLSGSVAGVLLGSVRFGEPDFLKIAISPTHLITGAYSTTLVITGTRTNGSKTAEQVRIFHTAGTEDVRIYVPLARSATGLTPTPTPLPFRWETPASASDRTGYGMTDESSLPVTFPPTFTFPAGGQSFSELRLHSDGYVTFASAVLTNTLPNTCLPRTAAPNQAVFGWWANLNPGALGASVSTFPLGNDRFVIEFADAPAVGASQPYTVSFQMVLYKNGDVGLNYEKTPAFIGAPAPVTVGASTSSGLFYNLIACATTSSTLGDPPSARQSFLIKSGDLF